MSYSEDRDALAAEAALGCLEGEDAREAARLTREDPLFAAAVAAWEAKLAPLGRIAPAVPPPADLWERIAVDSRPASVPDPVSPLVAFVPRRPRRGWFWPAATGVSLALAASLAAFIVLRPAAPDAVAVLTPVTGTAPVLVALESRTGTVIRPTGALSLPPDRDMELWALADGATRPVSLGVMPPGGTVLPGSFARGTQLLVSLEPKGGSPTGQPTGPVIYGGKLTALD